MLNIFKKYQLERPKTLFLFIIILFSQNLFAQKNNHIESNRKDNTISITVNYLKYPFETSRGKKGFNETRKAIATKNNDNTIKLTVYTNFRKVIFNELVKNSKKDCFLFNVKETKITSGKTKDPTVFNLVFPKDVKINSFQVVTNNGYMKFSVELRLKQAEKTNNQCYQKMFPKQLEKSSKSNSENLNQNNTTHKAKNSSNSTKEIIVSFKNTDGFILNDKNHLKDLFIDNDNLKCVDEGLRCSLVLQTPIENEIGINELFKRPFNKLFAITEENNKEDNRITFIAQYLKFNFEVTDDTEKSIFFDSLTSPTKPIRVFGNQYLDINSALEIFSSFDNDDILIPSRPNKYYFDLHQIEQKTINENDHELLVATITAIIKKPNSRYMLFKEEAYQRAQEDCNYEDGFLFGRKVIKSQIKYIIYSDTNPKENCTDESAIFESSNITYRVVLSKESEGLPEKFVLKDTLELNEALLEDASYEIDNSILTEIGKLYYETVINKNKRTITIKPKKGVIDVVFSEENMSTILVSSTKERREKRIKLDFENMTLFFENKKLILKKKYIDYFSVTYPNDEKKPWISITPKPVKYILTDGNSIQNIVNKKSNDILSILGIGGRNPKLFEANLLEIVSKNAEEDYIIVTLKPLVLEIHLDSNSKREIDNSAFIDSKPSLSSSNKEFIFKKQEKKWELKGPLKQPFQENDILMEYHSIKKENNITYVAIPKYNKINLKLNLLVRRFLQKEFSPTIQKTAKLKFLSINQPITINKTEKNKVEGTFKLHSSLLNSFKNQNLILTTNLEELKEAFQEKLKFEKKSIDEVFAKINFTFKTPNDRVLLIYYPLQYTTSYRSLIPNEWREDYFFKIDKSLRILVNDIKNKGTYRSVYVRFTNQAGPDGIKEVDTSELNKHLFLNVADYSEYEWSDDVYQEDYETIINNTSSRVDIIMYASFSNSRELEKELKVYKPQKIFLYNFINRSEKKIKTDKKTLPHVLVKNIEVVDEKFEDYNKLSPSEPFEFFNHE